MYKSILIPIDLSDKEKSKPMIELAKEVSGGIAGIRLLTVVEDLPVFAAAELPGGIIEKAKEKAKVEIDAIAEAAGLDKENAEVRSGTPSTSILAAASERQVDLVIIGSHKPALQDYFLGSTAARVVRHANCSVLVSR